jgi:hypothetical protein
MPHPKLTNERTVCFALGSLRRLLKCIQGVRKITDKQLNGSRNLRDLNLNAPDRTRSVPRYRHQIPRSVGACCPDNRVAFDLELFLGFVFVGAATVVVGVGHETDGSMEER